MAQPHQVVYAQPAQMPPGPQHMQVLACSNHLQALTASTTCIHSHSHKFTTTVLNTQVVCVLYSLRLADAVADPAAACLCCVHLREVPNRSISAEDQCFILRTYIGISAKRNLQQLIANRTMK